MADYTKTTWLDDDGSGTAGTALNATRLNNIETGIKNASAVRVATLPGSPVDGQVCYFQTEAMATENVTWQLMYRTSTMKWEFIGGPPLYGAVNTAFEIVSSTSYVALVSAGPSIALPLAGDYKISTGARIDVNTASTTGYMSYDIGGTGAVDADSLALQCPATSSSAASLERTARKTGLSAVTLTTKYRASGAANIYFSYRWMEVTPIRVG